MPAKFSETPTWTLRDLKAWAVHLDDVIPLVSCAVFSDLACGFVGGGGRCGCSRSCSSSRRRRHGCGCYGCCCCCCCCCCNSSCSSISLDADPICQAPHMAHTEGPVLFDGFSLDGCVDLHRQGSQASLSPVLDDGLGFNKYSAYNRGSEGTLY